jgi:hypothetical protein
MLAAHVGAGLAGALCLLAFSGSEAPQVLARFEGEAHERIVFTTEAAFVLWGVCAFSLCFAAGGVLFGADLLRFPSLQRRRVPRFKQFLPTLLARAFGWATGFAAAWTAALAVTLFRASGSVSSRSVIDIVRPYGFTHADPLRVDALARLWLLCYLQRWGARRGLRQDCIRLKRFRAAFSQPFVGNRRRSHPNHLHRASARPR